MQALLSPGDRPAPEKQARKALFDHFDYYVFGAAEQAGAHLPEAARWALAPIDAVQARRLRAQWLNRLNR